MLLEFVWFVTNYNASICYFFSSVCRDVHFLMKVMVLVLGMSQVPCARHPSSLKRKIVHVYCSSGLFMRSIFSSFSSVLLSITEPKKWSLNAHSLIYRSKLAPANPLANFLLFYLTFLLVARAAMQ